MEFSDGINMYKPGIFPTTSCFLSSPPNLPSACINSLVSLSVSNIWSRRGPWRGTTKKNPRQLTPQCHRMAGPERLCPWRQLRTTWANRGEAWGWMANLMAPNLRTTKNWDCLGNVDRLCLRVSQSVGVCYLSWCYASCCLVFQVPFMLVEVVNHLTFKYTPKHEPHVTPFSGSTPAVNVVWNSRKRCWCWIAHDCSIFMLLKKRGVPLFSPLVSISTINDFNDFAIHLNNPSYRWCIPKEKKTRMRDQHPPRSFWYQHINGHFRNLNWRYLPYLRPIFQAYVREYP